MDAFDPHFLEAGCREEVGALLEKTLALALDFKTRDRVGHHRSVSQLLEKYVVPLPEKGCSSADIMEFVDGLLRESINWSSPMFMGFNDAGNSVAGLMGSIVEATCQQNLINSDFCARAGTFVEIGVIRWLRELVGYASPATPTSVSDLGGVATTGGTCSNMYGMLMARKNSYPGFSREGLPPGARPRIFVAADITHYSVAAAVGLIGLGTDSLVKVPTKNFRYDLGALDAALKDSLERGEDAVCVVANAGDSRTLTLDSLERLIDVVRRRAPKCWIHVDACNGGQLIFSHKHREKLRGIERADSIALDPHKVFNVPYTLSCFLFREPAQLSGFWTSSTLIMRDPWALGQLTPNIGSKSWSSLKLYLLMKHLGRSALGEMIDRRIELAAAFRELLSRDARFHLVTAQSDVNAVPFFYVGTMDARTADPARLYRVNERLYAAMLKDGEFYVHGFGIKDDGDCLGRGQNQALFVLRFMSGQDGLKEAELRRLIDGLARLGEEAARRAD